MIKETDINRENFSGCYDLFKYVIRKYKTELPYNGSVIKTLESYCYRREHHFDRDGVTIKIWIMLNKDLFIAALMGRMKLEDYKTLHELKNEFKELQKNN